LTLIQELSIAILFFPLVITYASFYHFSKRNSFYFIAKIDRGKKE
jgi:hypothetical protein